MVTDFDHLDIRPLTPADWNGLSALFEEGGDPRWCWCTFWRVRGRDFANSDPKANRAMLHQMTAEAAAASNRPAPGLIAVEGDRVVGWVSVGPRSDFDRLEHSRVRPRLDDVPVWSIVCFVVSRTARRHGVARALLDAAVTYAANHGAPAIEAYPVATDGRKVPAANLYTGAWSTFEAAGFRIARNVDSPTATVRRLIVRRELSATSNRNLHPSGRIMVDTPTDRGVSSAGAHSSTSKQQMEGVEP